MAGQVLTVHCSQCHMPAMVPATAVGKSITCSRCGLAFVVQATGEGAAIAPPHLAKMQATVPVAPPAVQPPHLLKDKAPTPPSLPPPIQQTSSPATEAVETPDEEPRGRSPLLLGCLLLTTFLGFGVVIFAIVLFADWFAQRQNKSEPMAEVPMLTEDDLRKNSILKQKEEGLWTEATKRQYVHDGIAVRIDNVALAPVRFQSGSELLETERNYLIINFTITNKTFETINYQSWYSFEFETDKGKAKATCFDDRGDTFFIFPVPGADRVERHRYSEKPLAPRDETSDTLVFQIPLDYAQRPRKALYLKLPAAAVGKSGVFQLIIPPDMIVDRANVATTPLNNNPSEEGKEFNPSDPPLKTNSLDAQTNPPESTEENQ